MPTQTAKRHRARHVTPAPILPDALYPMREFILMANIGRSTRLRARAHGIELKTVNVGRLKYVNGADGIAFLHAAAAAQAAEKGAA